MMVRLGTVRGIATTLAAIAWWLAATMPAWCSGTERSVDVEKSRVYIYVDKTGLGHQHGVEGHLKSGTVAIGAEKDAGQLVFDMTSFRADTAAARKYVGLTGTTSESTKRQVNANMLGTQVLDVKHHPTATLDIDSATYLAQKSRRGYPIVEIKGRFTLHGVTRRVRILTELIEEKEVTRLHGGFRIRQTDYRIKPLSKAFGAIGVADELRIYGELILASTNRTPAGVNARAGQEPRR